MGERRSRLPVVWTEERNQALFDSRLRGSKLLEMLNALPGRKIASVEAVAVRKNALNYKNTGMSISLMDGFGVPTEEKEAFVLTTYQEARRWALRAGLCSKYTGLNLRAVNKARIIAGLPQLVLKGGL